MTEDIIPPQPDISTLVTLFKKFNEVTGVIQQDMSRVLLTDKANQ